jgi:signal transduction histidine kinase
LVGPARLELATFWFVARRSIQLSYGPRGQYTCRRASGARTFESIISTTVPPAAESRSPTAGLLVGLFVTLAAVATYAAYTTRQIAGLLALQTDMVDRNRMDTLQLLRIENDLNALGLAMRDMLDAEGPYPLSAWSAQFERIRADLDAALAREDQVAVARRTPQQREFLASSVTQFWDAANRTFALAGAGKEGEAREQIRLSLQARQASLVTTVARLLVENNLREDETAAQIRAVYTRVQRQVYAFFGATLVAIALTSLSQIRSNRRLFARLASLSGQRHELVQRLIATRESTLRHVSRELHDDFGQLLTAIGAMVSRAGRQAPEGSPLHADLREINVAAQATLDKVRSLSQALHPSVLDQAGLESALEWYLPTVERHSGLVIGYVHEGAAYPIDSDAGIHLYRVVQEALTNVSRHARTDRAWVRLRFLDEALQLDVEDHGCGFDARAGRGLGVVAMRERAELLGGTLEFLRPSEGGTLVRLTVPRSRLAEKDASGG